MNILKQPVTSFPTSKNIFTISLGALNIFLLSLLIVSSCKKDVNIQPVETPRLTILEAKSLYLLYKQQNLLAENRGDNEEEEGGHYGTHFELDWENAAEYSDAVRGVDVVEVPILENNLSTIHLVAENTTLDSSSFVLPQQINTLVVTEDATGAFSIAILKLNGTPGFNAAHMLAGNSFQHMNASFEGRLGYYTLDDSLLISYLVTNRNFYLPESPASNDSVMVADDRWDFCIDYYIYKRCTGDNHTWEQRNICKCGTPAALDCTPPQRIPVYRECHGPWAWNGGSNTTTIIPPILPPGSIWGNGGGTGGGNNDNNSSCYIQQIVAFDGKYGTHMQDDAEDIALDCFIQNPGCGETDFDDCLFETFFNSLYPAPPEGAPIEDVKSAFENCFGTACAGCTYAVTLYVDQPVPGDRDLWSLYNVGGSSKGGSINNGHAFLGYTQTNPATGASVTKTVGWYPKEHPSGSQEVKGYWYNEDANSQYNITVTYQITQEKFNNMVTFMNDLYWMYAAGYNNCTTAVIHALNKAEIYLPEKERYHFTVGKIKANPGDLGEDLRNATPQGFGGAFSSTPTSQYFSPSGNCQ